MDWSYARSQIKMIALSVSFGTCTSLEDLLHLPDSFSIFSQHLKIMEEKLCMRSQFPWLPWSQLRYVTLFIFLATHSVHAKYKLYAALYEWRTKEQQSTEFLANVYLDVYLGHINTLKHIQDKCAGAFCLIMADIYKQAKCYGCYKLIHLFCCTWPWVKACDVSSILPYLHVTVSKCTWCYFRHLPYVLACDHGYIILYFNTITWLVMIG